MKKIYLLLVCLVTAYVINAQSVSGTVTDENGEGLFGVNVIEKGTVNGTTTDFDGSYTLKLTTENPVIEFKFIGYRNKEIAYTGGKINHQMEVDEIGLDAVVVSASKRKERIIDAPASVTLINTEKIENTAAVTAADNLSKVAGVDVMPTGLVSQNVAVRGFNNIFSGGMLTLVDHRIGRVPSLQVNAFQLIPSNNADIENIEIVRGPGSALYGPNASSGVMHIITKSPLSVGPDHNAETTIGLTGGSRSVWSPEFRHAQKISDKVGFKVSGGYMQGHDFEYNEPNEPTPGDEYYLVSTRGDSEDTLSVGNIFHRNYFIRKYNADARVDVAVNKDIDLTFSAGYTNTTNLELTGLGAAQGKNWGYIYGQFRARWKDLFFNYFINTSNSGDTYMIPRVAPGTEGPHKFIGLLDKSKMHGIQLQHSKEIEDKWHFIYGADALLTRPNSDGTIYGVYENESAINQLGLYGQAEWNVMKKLTLLAALRGDYQTPINQFNISPRAAVVYKPTPRHTLRTTFNRAFSTPSALNLALDLPQTFIPNGIIGKGFGNPNGFNYMRNAQGLPMYLSPYDGQWYDVNDNSQNYNNFVNTTQSIGTVLGQALAGSPSLGVGLINALLFNGDGGDSLTNADLLDVPVVVTDFNTGEVKDISTIRDQESVKSTITQTFEIGYKGIIKDKFLVSADVFFSNIKNFVSPLTAASYRVQFDPNALAQVIAPVIQQNLDEESGTFPGYTYNDILSGQSPLPVNLNSDDNPSVFLELMGLLTGDPSDPEVNGYIYDFSSGTVAPDDPRVGDDLILTYLNYGTVNTFGADLQATYQHDKNFSISGMFSFMNKERYKLRGDDVIGEQYVYLNTPRFKSALSVDHNNIKETGLGVGATWRWQDAFRAESAVFVGDVNAANLVDMRISYRPKFSEGTIISGNFNNILNYKFQRFPGTPAIGFYFMGKISHTFKYNIGKNKKSAE